MSDRPTVTATPTAPPAGPVARVIPVPLPRGYRPTSGRVTTSAASAAVTQANALRRPMRVRFRARAIDLGLGQQLMQLTIPAPPPTEVCRYVAFEEWSAALPTLAPGTPLPAGLAPSGRSWYTDPLMRQLAPPWAVPGASTDCYALRPSVQAQWIDIYDRLQAELRDRPTEQARLLAAHALAYLDLMYQMELYLHWLAKGIQALTYAVQSVRATWSERMPPDLANSYYAAGVTLRAFQDEWTRIERDVYMPIRMACQGFACIVVGTDQVKVVLRDQVQIGTLNPVRLEDLITTRPGMGEAITIGTAIIIGGIVIAVVWGVVAYAVGKSIEAEPARIRARAESNASDLYSRIFETYNNMAQAAIAAGRPDVAADALRQANGAFGAQMGAWQGLEATARPREEMGISEIFKWGLLAYLGIQLIQAKPWR